MKFENIVALLNALSWSKMIQAFIFLIMIGLAYGLWENRAIVYNSLKITAQVEISEPVVLNITPDTSNLIDTAVNKAKDKIAAIQIINVDFKKNVRYVAYSAISNDNFERAYKQYEQQKISHLPLFSDKEFENQLIINLINGDFVCVDYKKSLGYTMFYKSTTEINTVCSISIPPYYGRFSGYINIYLFNSPTENDIISAKQLLRDISFRIYEVDMSNRQPHSIRSN